MCLIYSVEKSIEILENDIKVKKKDLSEVEIKEGMTVKNKAKEFCF